MNTLTFLNSPLLWGLGLASIPLIIHLLYRRKYRRVDWAPMHYLKLTIQRNRRRIRLEQLLLLLLRTAIIILLISLVARPVMHAEGLGKWLGGRSATSQILLVDDSLSMGHQTGGRSAFERAKELATSILKSVGPKDRFTLVLSSQTDAPLVSEIEVVDADKIARMIGSLQPSETFTSWEPTLKSVTELVAATTYPLREVTIVTDLRRSGWDKPLAEITDRWAGEQVRVRIFDVGSSDTANVAIESFEQSDRLALVGSPTRYEAIVRNGGESELSGLEANFLVDSKPNLVRLPAIAAGATARVPLLATFQEPGLHHVSLQLADDDLAGDNRRWWVTQAQENLNLLLVDGEPSSEPLGGETDFLALAMSLGIGDTDAFRVEVITDSQWSTLTESSPDMLVLANVANFTPPQIAALEKLVASGAGLMIFPGDQVDPDNYNQLLFKNGQGLLPLALENIADEELTGLIVENDPPSPLDALMQLSPAVLERLRIRKFFQLAGAQQPPEGVRVLARWNNAAGSPAAIEKVYGAGRVVLWTITADKTWSDWPTEPSYVLAMREAARAIARIPGGSRVVTTGQAIRRAFPAKHEITSATVEFPGGKRPQSLALESATDAKEIDKPAAGKQPSDKPAADAAPSTATTPSEDAPKQIRVVDTRKAGLYKLNWKDSQSGAGDDLFAANPDSRESDLTRLTVDEARAMWGTLEVEVISAVSGAEAPLAVRGQEIWRTLATCLLGFIFLEACFATWTGRQR